MIVGIVGSGAWGRALATLTAEAGNQPRVGYRGRPPGGFPGTPNLAALVAEADLTLVAVPPASVREVVRAARPGPGARVVIAARGVEPGTGAWLSDLVLEESAARRVGALAGPALAAEVLKRRPSAMVVASPYEEVCALAQRALHSPLCRIYTSRDLRGVELAGAMVQVLSVAVGVADGLDLGVGVRGVVVSRGLAEATRLGAALGAQPATFAGLAGVGDLVSCASHPDHPASAMLKLASDHEVGLPITEAIAAIASGRFTARLAMDALMRRDARAE